MSSYFVLNKTIGATTPLHTIDQSIIDANNDLTQQIDKISELLAFVEVYDPDTMINLNTWFEKISQMTASQYKTDISTIAVAAAQISEELILQNAIEDASKTINQPDLIETTQKHIKERLAQILTTINKHK
jgi:hypothetical protein